MAEESNKNLNRNVLLQAWARLSVYDSTASVLKQKSVRQRYVVVGLILVATVASVLTGIASENRITFFLAISALILPVMASYLMNDIVAFTGTTDWIKYRYTAEMMRMHIYLYRMQAGTYAQGPANKMDNRLSDNLTKLRDEVSWDGIIPPSVIEPILEDDIIATIKSANSYVPDDDGLSSISIEKFIEWRIDNQRAWYDKKVKSDFNRMKLFVRVAQFFLLLGSVVGALAGFISIRGITLIAVTNAVSAALTSWSSVSMAGTAYAIFMIAAQKLGDLKREWFALQDDPDFIDPVKNAKEIAKFAEKVENILLWERQEWYEMSLQGQAAGDKVIMEDLKRLTQRADDAQDNPPPVTGEHPS